MSSVFIAGCGYIGERLATSYRTTGCPVFCMVRSSERQEKLVAAGFSAYSCSLDAQPDLLCNCAGSVLFYLVPPPGGGITDTRARNFIQQLFLQDKPAKIVYMSATSVYNEVNGGIVNESSPTEPSSAMGKRRLDAEKAFQEYGASTGVPVVVLRVSGIYGPGRLPLMQVSQGQPLLKEDEAGPSNRIYVDDLVSVCMAAAEQGEAGDIFNVSDGNPSSMTSYFNLCADMLGYPRQPQVSREEAHIVMSPLMFTYATESKIVDSSCMMNKLGVTLHYPDMTIGVPAACQNNNLTPKA